MTTDNSVYNNLSRYVHGGQTEISGALEWWERKTIPPDATDTQYTVENKYAGRLDKIAEAAYGEGRLWWVIAMYNNILDPLTEIYPGRILILPTKDRIHTDILTGKLGGYPSERTEEKILPPVVV